MSKLVGAQPALLPEEQTVADAFGEGWNTDKLSEIGGIDFRVRRRNIFTLSNDVSVNLLICLVSHMLRYGFGLIQIYCVSILFVNAMTQSCL